MNFGLRTGVRDKVQARDSNMTADNVAVECGDFNYKI